MKEEFASIPKLGFGCMRLPLLDENDQTSIDIEQFKEMVDAFLEGGNTYFDTAFVYHEGASETAVRKALVERYPRDSFTIATKCLAWACKDEADAKSCLQTSLDRLGTDYVDFYLLHNLGGDRTAVFEKYGMWEFAQEMKAQGKIRHVGFSLHDGPEELEAILQAHPEAEFVQLQVNYLDWDDPVVQSRKCMEVAEKHGVPVVIMEPARGGRLVDLPERVAAIFKESFPDRSIASWAYRFCWNLPNTVATLSGMSTIGQVRENVADYAQNRPFSEQEQATLERAVEELKSVKTVPCTNCRYCVKGCPQQVAIPQILALLNLESMTENREFAKGLYAWQAKPAPASACIECGLCESMCPQKIDIIDELKVAAEHFE